MITVHVSASRNYDVLIGGGLLSSIGSFVAAMETVKSACIVSDSNVWPLYGHGITESLRNHGIKVISYVFPAGEASKSAETYLDLLNHLAASHLTRTDLIIALGGGVVGDLAGFAAATYLRGIPYIQIPTTLLAAVDSSVGGKTAIDLPAGKNLAGAFYQPHMVLCDTECLNTLPDNVFRDGCAEVIKYGILYDEGLFSHLMEHGTDFDREKVISRCVELKRDAVAADEYDVGARRLLNLGHTFGHAIEACSHYTISHGYSVASGMAIVARSACCAGICNDETAGRIINILHRFDLPISTGYGAADLSGCALSDKKRTGSTVHLVVPEQIGKCRIEPMSVEKIQFFLEAGL